MKMNLRSKCRNRMKSTPILKFELEPDERNFSWTHSVTVARCCLIKELPHSFYQQGQLLTLSLLLVWLSRYVVLSMFFKKKLLYHVVPIFPDKQISTITEYLEKVLHFS